MVNEDLARTFVEKARKGDREAFGELAELYRERLLAFASRRLGPDLRRLVDPEDVVQDALLRAFESLQRLEWRGAERLFAWLASILELRIRDLARSSLRRPQVPLEVDPVGEAVSPSRQLQREERFVRFEKALGRLSPDHAVVVRLARFEKLSISEISQRLDRSPGAVRHLLLRAMEKLRESFGAETESLHLPDRTFENREESHHD